MGNWKSCYYTDDWWLRPLFFHFPCFSHNYHVFNAFQAFKSTKNFPSSPDTSISMSVVQFPSRFFNLPGSNSVDWIPIYLVNRLDFNLSGTVDWICYMCHNCGILHTTSVCRASRAAVLSWCLDFSSRFARRCFLSWCRDFPEIRT